MVAVADRMDSIAGCFGIGMVPTGSEDPYALRRAALGVILILAGWEPSVSLSALTRKALELLADRITRPQAEASGDVLGFLRMRCEGIMADRGIPPDVASAVLQAIRGMNDVLPDDMALWRSFGAIVEAWLERWGYRAMRMPLVENTALFRRAIGESTDIVEKEMYSWRDELNAEELTLRPEGTASCVRAAIEHSLTYDGPKRLWYGGPM